jgi:putative SOS response-associated peptidase YedK
VKQQQWQTTKEKAPREGAKEVVENIESSKQPIRFIMKDGIISFAGLWGRWQGTDGEVIEPCTIIMTDANDLVRPVHDRVPVIIDPVDYAFWLDQGITEPEALKPMLVLHPVGRIDAYPVTKMVGRVTYNSPDAIKPLNNEKAE